MPRYRLVADHGQAVEEFDDSGDSAAEARARRLSPSYWTTQATGYRLLLQVEDVWREVRAWLPRRVLDHPGGPVDPRAPVRR